MKSYLLLAYIAKGGEFSQLYNSAPILRISGNELFDPSKLLDESQQTFDIVDNLVESTRVTEILDYV